MNLDQIPKWCLGSVVSSLPIDKITQLAKTSKNMADLCTSQAVWKEKYHNHFCSFSFNLEHDENNVNWLQQFSSRYLIPSSFSTIKQKVKSYKGKNVKKMKTFENCFAYSHDEGISLVIYDFFNYACQYKPYRDFKITGVKDFLFLDKNTILVICSSGISVIDIPSSNISPKNGSIDPNSQLEPINKNLFATVSSIGGEVFDISDQFDKKSTFQFSSPKQLISLGHDGFTLYIATSNDICAYDIRHGHAKVLWNHFNKNPASFCSFNTSVHKALFGQSCIDLYSGRLIVNTALENITSGAIIDDRLAVFGQNRSIVFYDCQSQKVGEVSHFQKTDVQEIKSIHASLNGMIAVAGEFDIYILKAQFLSDGSFSSEVVKYLPSGSIGLRQAGKIPPLLDVYFDGERLFTTQETFLRVYDFSFTPKIKS